MNELVISEVSATPLWRRLTSGRDEGSHDVARQIARVPGWVVQLRELLPVLERANRPIGRTPEGAADIYRAFQPLFIMYGREDCGRAEEEARWVLRYGSFASLPLKALEHAVAEYIRTSEIHAVPNPGRLTKLAQPISGALYLATYRGRLALKEADRHPERVIPPDERAEVREKLKGLTAEIRARAAPPHAPGRLARSPQEAAANIRAMVAAGLR